MRLGNDVLIAKWDIYIYIYNAFASMKTLSYAYYPTCMCAYVVVCVLSFESHVKPTATVFAFVYHILSFWLTEKLNSHYSNFSFLSCTIHYLHCIFIKLLNVSNFITGLFSAVC